MCGWVECSSLHVLAHGIKPYANTQHADARAGGGGVSWLKGLRLARAEDWSCGTRVRANECIICVTDVL